MSSRILCLPPLPTPPPPYLGRVVIGRDPGRGEHSCPVVGEAAEVARRLLERAELEGVEGVEASAQGPVVTRAGEVTLRRAQRAEPVDGGARPSAPAPVAFPSTCCFGSCRIELHSV